MDEKPAPQANPASMEVLVLGLCRTGTLSMKIALEELGYKNVYHFSTVDEDTTHTDLWIELLRRKYEPQFGSPAEDSKTNWYQLLRDYNAVTDIPAACFAPELIAAYPNAKIVLTTRSADSWQKSMLSTIHALQSSFVNRFLLLFEDKRTRKLSNLVDLIIAHYFRGSIPSNGVEVFEKHNEMVRHIALREKRVWLEFELGSGWEPLCEFLGEEVPGHGFPRVNDSRSWRRTFRLDWYRNIVNISGYLASLLILSFLFKLQR